VGDGALTIVIGLGIVMAPLLVMAGWFAAQRQQRVDRLIRHTVIIETTDARTIKGVLVASYADTFVMAHAVYVGVGPDGGQTEFQLPGEVWVPRGQVSFIHKPSLPDAAPSNL